jgi:hypothetical protein
MPFIPLGDLMSHFLLSTSSFCVRGSLGATFTNIVLRNDYGIPFTMSQVGIYICRRLPLVFYLHYFGHLHSHSTSSQLSIPYKNLGLGPIEDYPTI